MDKDRNFIQNNAEEMFTPIDSGFSFKTSYTK